MRKLIAIFLLLTVAAQAQEKITWPNHKKAVIVLTYDDAIPSQLNIAIPQLDSVNLKGTFFLTGQINSQTIPLWRAASKKGHELANHTLFHPCLSTEDNPVASNHYTIHQMIHEMELMNHLLFAVDGQSNYTYAYPCTETSVGGKEYVDSIRKYGTVKYARVGGDANAVITDFKHLDPLLVPSYGLEPNTPAEQLIAFAKKVQESGGMGVFMFHGVGGDYITTSAAAHKALLNYLKENKKDIWVATFREAMDYVEKQNM